jgi:protein-S-isoprenylcysteine O-methyltransferase Ste14
MTKMKSSHDPKVRQGVISWLVREALTNLVLIAILFGIAGRWDWWMGWAFCGIYICWSVSTAILILPTHPAMLAERANLHADRRQWDVLLIGVMAVMMPAEYVIASLDVRLGWSQPFAPLVQVLGLIVAVVGYDFLLVWAMVSNAFFVSTFRIQKERQHAVATGGPYRYVRHPGYLGIVLFHLAVPFMLNSLWALIPAFAITLIFIARTILEDRTLHAELPGYKGYAARVCYRLLPGVW